MSNLQTNVPLINVPLSTSDGRANPIWFQFFVQLWRRTGGAQGSSENDLRVSDIDIDPNTVSAGLQAAIDDLDETNTDLQLTVGDPDVPKLGAALNNVGALAQSFLASEGLTSQQAALISKIIDLSLMLEEAQEVAKKLRKAIDDAVIDGLIPLDPIRSMAYQDANKVAIGGGTINNTSVGATTASSGAFTTISATGQITSTLVTGTAPFSITSTTVVPNLNVSQLLGSTWAIPDAIGSITPNTGVFTTFTTTGNAAVATTSSSWGSGFKAIEVGAQGNSFFSATSGNFNSLLTNNAYYDGSNWRYARSQPATHVEQINGAFKFLVALSGTAGNTISWTQKFQVDTTGIGFFGTAGVAKPTITGSKGGNAALASLITNLAAFGLISDGTTP